MGFGFSEPARLLLLLTIPVIYYLYTVHQKKKRASSLKFSNLSIVKEASDKKTSIRRNLPFYILLLAIVLLMLGLANPHIPLKQAKEGVNVVLVIDDSGSMQATDYTPTRLEAAKRSAAILVRNLDSKDNVGIVVFESGATTAAYLTPYKGKALEKLKTIEPRQGKTAIGDGLALAIDMATSIPNKKKVVILLSDGVNNAGVVSPAEAVQFAKTKKIQVNTIGMGSVEPVVLGYDFFGRPQYAELDETTLKAIATETGGRYYKSVDDETLDEIYSGISQKIERVREETSVKDWFFGAALVVLLVYLYLIYGKYRIIV
ncbi:MAG: aerotolerance regulator BatA [Candidatus Methanogaster sp.]|uniref:Aerotolerance regulator BatA n=1 Tax=Candidatus Methanogaster sp. TaxID=3386292 RepID=A0AC61L2M5_9EURY|nr:MAG: aerotolerance regulator BatA [ANME-2 cluster archaeon]